MADEKNKVYQAFKEAAKELIEQLAEGENIQVKRIPEGGTAAFLKSQDGTEQGVYIENDGVKQYRKPPMMAKLFNDPPHQGEAEERVYYTWDWRGNKIIQDFSSRDWIDKLELPPRVENTMLRGGAKSIDDLKEIVEYWDNHGYINIRVCGAKTIEIVRQALIKHGYISN